MNIIHLQLSGGIGGISVLSKDINKISQHRNFFYFLFEGGCIADEIAQEGGTVFVAEEKHKDIIGASVRFIRYCKEHKIDVVICHTGSPITRLMLCFAKTVLKKRCILYLHSNAKDMLGKGAPKDFISQITARAAHRSADYSVAISQSVKKSFVSLCHFDPSKTAVIYNGTDINKFDSDGQRHSSFQMIFVGRVIRNKGVTLLISALSKLPKGTDFHLSVLGKHDEDGYLEEIQRLVETNHLQDKVSLQGPQRNIPQWLSRSDLYIHPAIWEEGFGITIIEALAAHLPCAAIGYGAVPEIIQNGYNGFLAKQADADELAQTILHCYWLWKKDAETYQQLRRHARESVMQFQIQNTVEQLEKLYL